MTSTRIRLTRFKVPELEQEDRLRLEADKSSGFSETNVALQWRQNLLFVTAAASDNIGMHAFRSESWIKDCLKLSSIKAVCLDFDLDETVLRRWTDACHEVNKPVFLRLPLPASAYPQPFPDWWARRLIDMLMAAIALLLLSPLIGILIVLLKQSSPDPIFLKQWCIGYRGQLFKVWKFRATVSDSEALYPGQAGSQQGSSRAASNRLGRFMRRWGLDQVPRLVNVLRGEMSLFGPLAWTLDQAILRGGESLCRLRVLPGIADVSEVLGHPSRLEAAPANPLNLTNLQSKSLLE